jgi:Multidrug resistance efflux pump
MTSKLLFCTFLITAIFFGCDMSKNAADAFGTFEGDEVIVSSAVPGRIQSLNLEEGSILSKDSIVGMIDSIPFHLQKAQVEASINALHEKTMDVRPQVKLLKDQIVVQKAQLDNLLHERQRTENLIKADAATTKQLDDLNTQIDVLKKQITVIGQQIKVQEATTGTQNTSVLSEDKPLRKSVAQINYQLSLTNIVNPVNGTVLTKYAMAGEITTAGKALYKIADLSMLTLRAYITGAQLAKVKLNQPVTVMVDSSATKYRKYPGVITMISDKAEFTPKTIQTKEERANLVYAIKIRVKNDGYLKIGMYGEVKFN